jgi:hypothetical protein
VIKTGVFAMEWENLTESLSLAVKAYKDVGES